MTFPSLVFSHGVVGRISNWGGVGLFSLSYQIDGVTHVSQVTPLQGRQHHFFSLISHPRCSRRIYWNDVCRYCSVLYRRDERRFRVLLTSVRLKIQIRSMLGNWHQLRLDYLSLSQQESVALSLGEQLTQLELSYPFSSFFATFLLSLFLRRLLSFLSSLKIIGYTGLVT